VTMAINTNSEDCVGCGDMRDTSLMPPSGIRQRSAQQPPPAVWPGAVAFPVGVEPSDRRPTLPYVMVPHEPDFWVRAHVEKQCTYNGQLRLSCYYFVGRLQQYRVYDADQVRPVGSAPEFPGDEQPGVPAGHEPAQGEHDPCEPIDLRDARRVPEQRLAAAPAAC
jgi:hypothetical protein